MVLAPLSAGFQSLPPYPQAKWPLLVLIPSRWACVHSRTMSVSPMHSPVSLGLSPTSASTPTGVFNQRFEALFPPHWNSGLRGMSLGPPDAASLASCSFAHPTPQSTTSLSQPATALLQVLSARLPISAPPTGLDECFFFISLVVGLPYSSIFCQFWLFFVFKLLLSVLSLIHISEPTRRCD